MAFSSHRIWPQCMFIINVATLTWPMLQLEYFGCWIEQESSGIRYIR